MSQGGKRVGSRRAARRPPTFRPRLLGLALGVTLAVIAWGYLVYAAIDFGATARGGEAGAWTYLGLASVGAVACLFIGLMLIARLLRELGITSAPPPRPAGKDDSPAPAPVPPGGRRAAR